MSIAATDRRPLPARAPRCDWPFLTAAVLATARAGRAGAARRPAGGRGADRCRGFALGVGVPQGRVQLHRVVAAADRARPGRRPARRAAADRDCGGGDRAGGGAGAGLRRRDRAARAVARDRRLRVRHRHAARQRLRLRHALHRRRRLRPHADHARVLHRRQRDRQPASAGVPGARRHRSDPRRRTISGPGAGLPRPGRASPSPRRSCIAIARRRGAAFVPSRAHRHRRGPDRAALRSPCSPPAAIPGA